MQRANALQLKVGAAFAAVVLGFVGAAAYLPPALWHLTLRAEEIQRRHSEEVRQVSNLRGCGREIASLALLAFHATSPGDRDAHVAELDGVRDRCASAVAAYSRTIVAGDPSGTDSGRERWRHFMEDDLLEWNAAVEAVLAAAREPAPDEGAVRRLVAVARDADAQLQGLVALRASSARRSAEQIHAGLGKLSSLYLALAALGAAGAFILLVETVRIVRRYARAVDRQLADLDAFGGHVAHDLRGPLQTVQLAVAAIQQRADDAGVKKLAGAAAAGVRRLDGMIRDLLQFARGGAVRPDRATARVATAVARACEGLAERAQGSGATLSVSADPGVIARIAPVALEAVVVNLVENAIKYGCPGRPNPVTVTATSDGREVRIAVCDAGQGIAPDLRPHLFEPFVRGSTRPDSFGLGLATVKRLVDAHRGRIEVESKPGRGTTFVVRLPAASPRRPGALARAGRVPPRREAPPATRPVA